MDQPEYLVVGLGNPGEEYKLTPHNLGFLVVDRLAESHAIRVSRKENTSLVGLGAVAGKPVALAQPQTFMNVNGPAVK
jgi:PTH1 family peptidyl-tRNA hydrolase